MDRDQASQLALWRVLFVLNNMSNQAGGQQHAASNQAAGAHARSRPPDANSSQMQATVASQSQLQLQLQLQHQHQHQQHQQQQRQLQFSSSRSSSSESLVVSDEPPLLLLQNQEDEEQHESRGPTAAPGPARLASSFLERVQCVAGARGLFEPAALGGQSLLQSGGAQFGPLATLNQLACQQHQQLMVQQQAASGELSPEPGSPARSQSRSPSYCSSLLLDHHMGDRDQGRSPTPPTPGSSPGRAHDDAGSHANGNLSSRTAVEPEPRAQNSTAQHMSSGNSAGAHNHGGKQKRLYKCHNCPFETDKKSDYWVHIRVHMKPEKQLACDSCQFVTQYKHHLEYHQRNHTGFKPFKCDHCDYRCVNKSMLNSHMKSHSSVYQYQCGDCKYVTKYVHSLKMHLRKYDHRPAQLMIDVYGRRRGPKPPSNNNNNNPGNNLNINITSNNTNPNPNSDRQQQQLHHNIASQAGSSSVVLPMDNGHHQLNGHRIPVGREPTACEDDPPYNSGSSNNNTAIRHQLVLDNHRKQTSTLHPNRSPQQQHIQLAAPSPGRSCSSADSTVLDLRVDSKFQLEFD